MKNANLTALLWALSGSITATLILLIVGGLWPAVEFGIVSSLAMCGWLSFSYKETPGQTNITPIYILSIVLFLILSTLRYASDYSLFLKKNFSYLFDSNLTVNHTSWFVLMVCLPASLLLLGGYYLSKRTSIGFYFCWWGFLFGIAESTIQFKIELSHLNTYSHLYFLGIFISIGLFLLCMNGLVKLIRPDYRPTEEITYKALTKKQINLWSALFVFLVIIYATTLYSEAGILPVGVIVGSMMGGLIGWRKTTALTPANPHKFVPLYLLLLTFFYIHVGEETLTHFNQSIAVLSGHPWSDSEFDYLIAFIGPVFWVFAAYSLWKQQAFGNFILWFMIVGMILGEPTHILVFPVVTMCQQHGGYTYFSGMYTALFPMIPAILALVALVKDKREKEYAKTAS